MVVDFNLESMTCVVELEDGEKPRASLARALRTVVTTQTLACGTPSKSI